MQVVLTILTVSGAIFYLVQKFYGMWKENKTKCTGCAVHKIYVSSKKN